MSSNRSLSTHLAHSHPRLVNGNRKTISLNSLNVKLPPDLDDTDEMTFHTVLCRSHSNLQFRNLLEIQESQRLPTQSTQICGDILCSKAQTEPNQTDSHYETAPGPSSHHATMLNMSTKPANAAFYLHAEWISLLNSDPPDFRTQCEISMFPCLLTCSEFSDQITFRLTRNARKMITHIGSPSEPALSVHRLTFGNDSKYKAWLRICSYETDAPPRLG